MTHDLKSWPEFFAPIFNGSKTFELRVNDRGFKVGDILNLLEYDDQAGRYTGRKLEKRVTYVLEGIGPGSIDPLKGLHRGYVILALAEVAE